MDTTHIDVKELCVRSVHIMADGTPEDFEAVVRIELPTALAEDVLREHPDATGVDYAVNLWWRRY